MGMINIRLQDLSFAQHAEIVLIFGPISSNTISKYNLEKILLDVSHAIACGNSTRLYMKPEMKE